jgi:hypothetical protein
VVAGRLVAVASDSVSVGLAAIVAEAVGAGPVAPGAFVAAGVFPAQLVKRITSGSRARKMRLDMQALQSVVSCTNFTSIWYTSSCHEAEPISQYPQSE